MAIIKYAPGANPRRNKQKGFTFQRNNYGESMFPEARNDRTRNISQHAAMTNLQKAVRFWREMSAATKQNWNDFAAAYPQASRRNPATFLTGYQLFIKRNHYQFLFCGLRENFLESPTMELLADPGISFAISSSGTEINITELYLSHFGFLPAVGDHVLLRAYPMATNSGQFFTPIEQIIKVDEIFIDGMFISLVFASPGPGISVSIYLSKIINQSISYVGTKVKYMGCFSSKTFLNLTDTPDDYAGQAEKQVAVKADESGLEFVEGGGGGLTCESLYACSIIESILEAIQNLASIVISASGESIPLVKYGLLYNSFLLDDPLFFPSGWRLPTYAEADNIQTLLGGALSAGCHLKEIGTIWWNAPNSGASNSIGFNLRGSGFRYGPTGQFYYLKSTTYIWCSDFASTTKRYYAFGARSSDCVFLRGSRDFNSGLSVRLVRSVSGILDGAIGSCVGNNGRIYKTIGYNGLEIMADNYAETKLRDGSAIPELDNTGDWSATSSGALCAYSNNWDNV